MSSIIIITTILIGVAALALNMWGRKSKECNQLKKDLEAEREANEILKKQRDNRITNVDDANRMWDNHKKD